MKKFCHLMFSVKVLELEDACDIYPLNIREDKTTSVVLRIKIEL